MSDGTFRAKDPYEMVISERLQRCDALKQMLGRDAKSEQVASVNAIKVELESIVDEVTQRVHGLTDRSGLERAPQQPIADMWASMNPGLAARIWHRLLPGFIEYEFLVTQGQAVAESPIEALLIGALFTENACYLDGPPVLVQGQKRFPEMVRDDDGPATLYIAPQFQIGAHRVDLAVFYSYTGRRFVIECDGAEFHEGKGGQVQQDRERDRTLAAEDWPVMRFSGSEIHRNPYACSKRIAEALAKPTREMQEQAARILSDLSPALEAAGRAAE